MLECKGERVGRREMWSECVRWSSIDVQYSFLKANQSIIAKVYCNPLKEMNIHLRKMRPALLNHCGSILLQYNEWSHVAKMMMQELTPWKVY